MTTTIVMPQLGESVAEGVIGKWLKNEGDTIQRDEPIVEVITDKVNAEIPSPVAGVIEKITQPEGATVAVGQEIAIIGDGEGRKSAPSPATAAAADQGSSSAAPEDGNGREPAGGVAVAAEPSRAGNAARVDRVRSSPLVRRLAEQFSINLAEVTGTGIGGRVSKQDILSFVEQREASGAPRQAVAQAPSIPLSAASPQVSPSAKPGEVAPQPAIPRGIGPNEELVPVSPIRKMIADRMVQSVTTIPHATTMVEVDMTHVVRYRDRQKDEFRRREGVPLSYVALVVKATVEALKQFPDVNAEWGETYIVRKRDININVAVDAPDGLITPVVHGADAMSLAGLSRAINDLTTRAREKGLRVEDMQGGTFTVNNTGALGSVLGVSIINPPQAGILSAAAIVKRPVVVEQDGQDLIAVRHMMNLILSFDHRVLDGGYSSAFLSAIKTALESWPQDYPLY